jgi:hypothetical protein
MIRLVRGLLLMWIGLSTDAWRVALPHDIHVVLGVSSHDVHQCGGRDSAVTDRAGSLRLQGGQAPQQSGSRLPDGLKLAHELADRPIVAGFLLAYALFRFIDHRPIVRQAKLIARPSPPRI